jgi:hypothetical protein
MALQSLYTYSKLRNAHVQSQKAKPCTLQQVAIRLYGDSRNVNFSACSKLQNVPLKVTKEFERNISPAADAYIFQSAYSIFYDPNLCVDTTAFQTFLEKSVTPYIRLRPKVRETMR